MGINKSLSSKNGPIIIAEMSANHNQSFDRAIKLVEAAADAGVTTLKLQTCKPEKITLDIDREDFVIKDSTSLWNGRKLFDLYTEACTPWEWHKPIFEKCKELGIIGFSTPFDETAVDFLESLNVPCYKIASFEIVDIPLIKKVASTGKPMIISTGMSIIEEIQDAVDAARSSGCQDIILLKCTSAYPASPNDINLMTLSNMKERFNCEVGVSDHTLGIGVSIASIALGATIIEKHFTLSREDGGVDAAFSMEPDEMKQLVVESERAWQAIGEISYGPTEHENNSFIFRRSLYVVEDMKKGEVFTRENLRSIRPGYGLPPKYFDKLLGRPVKRNVRRGTAVNREMFE